MSGGRCRGSGPPCAIRRIPVCPLRKLHRRVRQNHALYIVDCASGGPSGRVPFGAALSGGQLASRPVGCTPPVRNALHCTHSYFVFRMHMRMRMRMREPGRACAAARRPTRKRRLRSACQCTRMEWPRPEWIVMPFVRSKEGHLAMPADSCSRCLSGCRRTCRRTCRRRMIGLAARHSRAWAVWHVLLCSAPLCSGSRPASAA